MANFSLDVKLLASSSRDNTARIWDVATGQILHTFDGFRCAAKVAMFSPDGRLFAASGNDGMLKLWDVKSYKELQSMVNKSTPVTATARLASGTSRVEKRFATDKRTRNTAFKVLLTSDYRRLVSFGDALVKVWDTSSWREIKTLSFPKTAGSNYTSSTLAISHNGKLIAASYVEIDAKQNTYVGINTIVWNAKTGEKLYSFSGVTPRFSPRITQIAHTIISEESYEDPGS